MIDINVVPEDIQDTQLEESIYQALSHAGTIVLPSDLEYVTKRGKKMD